jgi:2-oxoglutarate ferredoxin oxidoreductase subunit beta
VPKLVEACGATYVSRFTTLEPKRLTDSIAQALTRRGFRFIEVIAPCPELYGRRNRLGQGLDLMQFYQDNARLEHEASLDELDIAFQKSFVVGCFVDRERSGYDQLRDQRLKKVLGESYLGASANGGKREG